MPKNEVKIRITGDNSGLSTSLQESEAKLGGLQTKSAGGSKVIGGAFLAAGAAVAAFGVSSVKAFETAGKETAKLSRLTGGTAEDMSTLRFIGQQTGVSFDTLAKSVTIFSKSAQGAGKKALDDLNVSMKNADGTTRPFTAVLGDLAGRFQAMPNGLEKNALAMKLFGKSGADMVPLLNRGKDGIAELTAKAKEMGVVLNEEALIGRVTAVFNGAAQVTLLTDTGASDTTRGVTVAQMADDAVAVMDAAGVAKAAVGAPGASSTFASSSRRCARSSAAQTARTQRTRSRCGASHSAALFLSSIIFAPTSSPTK